MVFGSTWALKTLEGRWEFNFHSSPMKEGTKLVGMFLKALKKSAGLTLLAF
jgi:hypothetical protein